MNNQARLTQNQSGCTAVVVSRSKSRLSAFLTTADGNKKYTDVLWVVWNGLVTKERIHTTTPPTVRLATACR